MRRSTRTRIFSAIGIAAVVVIASLGGVGTLRGGDDPAERAAARTINCGARGVTRNGICAGTTGADRLTGTTRAEKIIGKGGNDTVAAAGGNDDIRGDAGNDDLAGDAGSDRIHGGPGADRLSGGGGNDLLDARDGASNDTITCGAGTDVAYADLDDTIQSRAACERIVQPLPPRTPDSEPDPEEPAPETPEPAATVPALAFVGAVTDNYKACWNAAPDTRERRTFGAVTSVSVGSSTYLPVGFTEGDQFRYAETLPMRLSTGGPAATAELRMTVQSGAAQLGSTPRFRVSRGANFGPFLSVAPTFDGPFVLRVQLVTPDGATTLASSDVSYAPSAFPGAQAKPNCDTATGARLEWNGPGGQFSSNGVTWQYNWDPAAPATARQSTASADPAATRS